MEHATPPALPPCPNCGAVATGPFCAQCGQDNRYLRLRVRDYLLGTFEAVTSLETAYLRTWIGLWLRPGLTVREFVEGRRVRYMRPLRYALIHCAVWWLVLALTPLPDATESLTEVQREGVAAFWENGQLLNLALAPALAPVLLLVFFGARATLAECLAVALYFAGHLFGWRAILALGRLFPVEAARWLGSLDGVLVLVYFPWTLFGFYRGRVAWIWLRIPVALVLYSLVTSVTLLLFAKWRGIDVAALTSI